VIKDGKRRKEISMKYNYDEREERTKEKHRDLGNTNDQFN